MYARGRPHAGTGGDGRLVVVWLSAVPGNIVLHAGRSRIVGLPGVAKVDIRVLSGVQATMVQFFSGAGVGIVGTVVLVRARRLALRRR